ncbi:hypothetical protein EOM60_02060 [Candidatus Saccharibacteria bacterium]|nr:hypothetical protein [Candidatus Saccharibacteria bacterium]
MVQEIEKINTTIAIEHELNPRNLPEAGFQSYEKLKNDASTQKASFLSGRIRNPELAYPHLQSLNDMDRGIIRLREATEFVERLETDGQKASIIKSSLEFRMAEMEYIKLLGRLDFVTKEGRPEEEVRELAEEVRTVGEQLYGVPDPEIRDAALAEIWSQLDKKQLSPSAQQLYGDLRDGFSWNDREIAPLSRPEVANKLPDFNHPSLVWAGEIILEDSAELEAYFREWWDAKVAEYGEDYVARPEDIVEAFQGAFRLLDPDSKSGVGVILDPEASALSWESPLMAVKVGGKRPPIRSAAVLFQKFLHEGKGHGGRAISGLKSGLPVLGTGLYTNTVRPDYLTFEEGFCTTIEEVVSGDEPKWDGVKLGHYINISLVADGSDFRSTFETAWRYRLLMKLKNGQEVTDEMIAKEQEAAYTALVRVFRGTPTNMSERYPDIPPLTFNKDLAYLNGRVLAMNHIAELYKTRDKEGLMRLFTAKYDPTIPEQQEIVNSYGYAA